MNKNTAKKVRPPRPSENRERFGKVGNLRALWLVSGGANREPNPYDSNTDIGTRDAATAHPEAASALGGADGTRERLHYST
jgi:hypothetical protein